MSAFRLTVLLFGAQLAERCEGASQPEPVQRSVRASRPGTDFAIVSCIGPTRPTPKTTTNTLESIMSIRTNVKAGQSASSLWLGDKR